MLLRKQTFPLRRSHMKKARTKYGEIFYIILIILSFMAISSKSVAGQTSALSAAFSRYLGDSNIVLAKQPKDGLQNFLIGQ